jgi:LPXTG-motif cell wall-anchored protein
MRVLQRSLLIPAACTSLALVGGIPSTAQADDHAAPQRVQVVMVNFTDSSFKDPASVKSAISNVYFGKSDSLTSYYNEVSRGATTFKPAAAGDDGVVGPIDIPLPADGCHTSDIYRLAEEALEKTGTGWKDYEHLSIVFPSDKAGCGFGGLGQVGGGVTWVPTDGSVDMTVLVHEFGHNFGYHHQMRYNQCSGTDLSTCQQSQTTSHKTPMGGGTIRAGLSAPELIRTKWLSDKEAVQVTKSATYTLHTLYGPGDGVRAVDIPDGSDRIVVELRGPSGTLDQDMKGVHAYRVPNGDYANSSLIDITPSADEWVESNTPYADALEPGTTLTDKANKVEIKVLKSSTGSATVAVSLNGTPAPAPAPAQPPTPSTGGTAPRAQNTAAPTAVAPATSGVKDNPQLAETGTDSKTTLPLATGGAAVLAVGAAFLLRTRRKRTATARHGR